MLTPLFTTDYVVSAKRQFNLPSKSETGFSEKLNLDSIIEYPPLSELFSMKYKSCWVRKSIDALHLLWDCDWRWSVVVWSVAIWCFQHWRMTFQMIFLVKIRFLCSCMAHIHNWGLIRVPRQNLLRFHWHDNSVFINYLTSCRPVNNGGCCLKDWTVLHLTVVHNDTRTHQQFLTFMVDCWFTFMRCWRLCPSGNNLSDSIHILQASRWCYQTNR